MKLDKEQVLELVRHHGDQHRVGEAEQSLPMVVDTEDAEHCRLLTTPAAARFIFLQGNKLSSNLEPG